MHAALMILFLQTAVDLFNQINQIESGSGSRILGSSISMWMLDLHNLNTLILLHAYHIPKYF